MDRHWHFFWPKPPPYLNLKVYNSIQNAASYKSNQIRHIFIVRMTSKAVFVLQTSTW